MQFREAKKSDLGAIIELLANDRLGAGREGITEENPLSYERAFAEISADPNNQLIVVCSGDEIVGTFQLTFIPGMSFRGGKRALVEAVRVKSSARGQGIGREIFQWIVQRAREKGCYLVQLTSNKQRGDAIRFYESVGFSATHEGMKLYLDT